MPDISNYLSLHPEAEVTLSNFTFAKELVYREPFEIERSAKQKSIYFASSEKKKTNQTTMNQYLQPSTTSKALRNKQVLLPLIPKSEKPLKEVLQNKLFLRNTRLTTSTQIESATIQSVNNKSTISTLIPQSRSTNKSVVKKRPKRSPAISKFMKLREEINLKPPCTRFCNVAAYQRPTIQCAICLCMFHPSCLPSLPRNVLFACKPCTMQKIGLYERVKCRSNNTELDSTDEMPSYNYDDIDIEELFPTVLLTVYSEMNEASSASNVSPVTLNTTSSETSRAVCLSSNILPLLQSTVAKIPQENCVMLPTMNTPHTPCMLTQLMKPIASNASKIIPIVNNFLNKNIKNQQIQCLPSTSDMPSKYYCVGGVPVPPMSVSTQNSLMVRKLPNGKKIVIRRMSNSSSSTNTDKLNTAYNGTINNLCGQVKDNTKSNQLNQVPSDLNDNAKNVVFVPRESVNNSTEKWEKVDFRNLYINDWNKCGFALQKRKTKSLNLSGILYQDKHNPWEDLEENVVRLTGIEELIFDKITPSLLKSLVFNLPQLVKLECNFITTVFTEPEIWTTPCEVDLSSLRYVGRLRKLKIASGSKIILKKNSRECLFPYLPNLKSVSLTGFNFCSNLNLENISYQKYLVSLELGDCKDIEPGIYSLLGTLTNLKRLRLLNGGSIDDIHLAGALLKLKGLEVLELLDFTVSRSLAECVGKLHRLFYLKIFTDNSHRKGLLNHNIITTAAKCQNLKFFCWGFITDGDNPPDMLEMEDSMQHAFKDVYSDLLDILPKCCTVEMKWVKKDMWKEFLSSEMEFV
ncbi:THAP-type domain-containing protein [Caerostris extrusa]|uniref:THAP-type domain-containing protein n=1 Tax=Caerostris extrusa TaxID=172846 RepID=A0AAV4U412_CAEEX|nr:THAP-type domain-containing protein [Caerostris extrusa]